ncbi:hypothetical protein [Flavobacterium sp. J27]|uniref:hypothetical protein n=1 Tax=Flavobacterium sp. J27 TaxID=2060419 RepID=UPI00102F8D65|nr:hypothetical protein [Flavobacterium sp. J27]
MFILFSFLSCNSFLSKENEKSFVKKYRLLKLDGEICNTCFIDVQENYIYKIFKNEKEIGKGEWNITLPIDYPGYVLKLENGPKCMIYDSDTIIDYIDRRKFYK